MVSVRVVNALVALESATLEQIQQRAKACGKDLSLAQVKNEINAQIRLGNVAVTGTPRHPVYKLK